MKQKPKCKKTLDSFITYCYANPEERFWQALRNWSGYTFIFGRETNKSIIDDLDKLRELDLEDTFLQRITTRGKGRIN